MNKLLYYKELNVFVLLIIVIFSSNILANNATRIDITGPTGSGSFGSSVKALPNGNIVVIDSAIGAVYLYNGATGDLISVLKGDRQNDRVGSFGVTVLPEGNYLVLSPNWHSDMGAVTFCSKTAGCNGIVSESNSLVGSRASEQVGLFGATILSNGNYVVSSPYWNVGRGAFTWGSGMTGVSGILSASNSMVGTVAGEGVGRGVNGTNGITPLTNGNYVVISSAWNDNRGAATFCNGAEAGCVGNISSANSLVGTSPLDSVGVSGVTELKNGNYVVKSSFWNNGAESNVGAATWGSGIIGISGEVSASNSLIGSVQNNQISNVGSNVLSLTNGNYVVQGSRGVTFGNGISGTSGVVSAVNSLVATFGDDFELTRVVALTNGNYVVVSPRWDLNAATPNVGAVTLGNGTSGTIGTISSSNSLIGNAVNNSIGGDGVTALTNGNYVVQSDNWNSSRGAVTFGNGTTGVIGIVSASNSLVGSTAGDRIGEDGVTALTNGNYVVRSSDWDNGTVFNAGAVTFGNGSTGISGVVSTTNSLVGTHTRDEVGSVGVSALPNGNYVVCSREWDGYRGAATFGNGETGVIGEVSAANSLVGSNPNDNVCLTTTLLANGNYVVSSYAWNENRGAITFGNDASGVSGIVSASNSLVGSSPNDRVGGGNNLRGVIALTNGDYVVSSSLWNGNAGAVTWGNGATGISGVVSSSNSLVGSSPLDLVGNGSQYSVVTVGGITALPNGNYVVFSPDWDNASIVDAGAVSLGKANTPITGTITADNSIRGTATGYGSTIVFAYDTSNKQIVVGRPGDNVVSIFRHVTDIKSRKRVRFF